MWNSYISQIFRVEYYGTGRLTSLQPQAGRIHLYCQPQLSPVSPIAHMSNPDNISQIHSPTPLFSSTEKTKTKTKSCLLARSLAQSVFGRMVWREARTDLGEILGTLYASKV